MHELLDEGNTEKDMKSYTKVGAHLYVKTKLDMSMTKDKDVKGLQVVFLMGGGGTRLRHVTNDKYSKHMIEVAGKPISMHTIEQWTKAGFKELCFLIDDTHRGKSIRDYYKDGKSLGANVKYSAEHGKLGSGGALKLAIENGTITKDFINHFPDDQIIGYDNFAMDFAKVFVAAVKAGYQAVILCVPGKLYPYGEVIDKNGKVTDFIEKPFIWKDTNTGIFGIARQAFGAIKTLPGDQEVKIERTVFKQLAQAGKVFKVLLPSEYWIPVNDEPDLKKFIEVACGK